MAVLLSVLRWPNALFAAKTFGAAILALYLAFWNELDQPSWAFLTAIVVSQPSVGAGLSRSMHRLLGTLIAAVVCLVLAALFNNKPVLFVAALACWVSGCVFVAVYLRDLPAAYAATLSGFTAAIIGIPAAMAPDTAFFIAQARVTEVGLGVVCAAMVHKLVFPRPSGALWRDLCARTMSHASQWAAAVLSSEGRSAAGEGLMRSLVADIYALRLQRPFALLDTPELRRLEGELRDLEVRLTDFVAILSAVEERVFLLGRTSAAAIRSLEEHLQRVATLFRADVPANAAALAAFDAEAAATKSDLAPAVAAAAAEPGGEEVLRRTILLQRQIDILDIWQIVLRRNLQILEGRPERGEHLAPHLYRDWQLAWVGACVTFITIVSVSAFWFATAWSSGPSAVTFAAVLTGLLAAQDNPRAAAMTWLIHTLPVLAACVIGLYVILPFVNDFAALALALAPFYLFWCLFLADAKTMPIALPQIFLSTGLMSLQNDMTWDLAALLNGFVGTATGIVAGAIAFGVLRPLGARWTLLRLKRGIFGDLAWICREGDERRSQQFRTQALDRVTATLTRLDTNDPGQMAWFRSALAALRIGHQITALRAVAPSLPAELKTLVTEALADLAAFFERKRSGRGGESVADLERIGRADAILRSGTDAPGVAAAREAVDSIRMMLELHRRFFEDPGVTFAPAGPPQPATAPPATVASGAGA